MVAIFRGNIFVRPNANSVDHQLVTSIDRLVNQTEFEVHGWKRLLPVRNLFEKKGIGIDQIELLSQISKAPYKVCDKTRIISTIFLQFWLKKIIFRPRSYFGQKLRFWTKITILVKIRNISKKMKFLNLDQNSKFCSKIEIFVNNLKVNTILNSNNETGLIESIDESFYYVKYFREQIELKKISKSIIDHKSTGRVLFFKKY